MSRAILVISTVCFFFSGCMSLLEQRVRNNEASFKKLDAEIAQIKIILSKYREIMIASHLFDQWMKEDAEKMNIIQQELLEKERQETEKAKKELKKYELKNTRGPAVPTKRPKD